MKTIEELMLEAATALSKMGQPKYVFFAPGTPQWVADALTNWGATSPERRAEVLEYAHDKLRRMRK